MAKTKWPKVKKFRGWMISYDRGKKLAWFKGHFNCPMVSLPGSLWKKKGDGDRKATVIETSYKNGKRRIVIKIEGGK